MAPLEVLGMWVGPKALLVRAGVFLGLCRWPSWGGAARHLRCSRLLSGVLAWPLARDASSLCHSP